MKDGRPFFMAGLWSDAPDMTTGEITDSYTVIITEANAIMRVHDRMPAILSTEAARQWLEPGPLRPELLRPYPAEEMTAWRVIDDAKNPRIEPHPGMAEPVCGPAPKDVCPVPCG
jgi:putative SOS response-associated peptidase YedK